MTALRLTPFRRVLYRPNLLLGGERGLVILSGTLLALIPLSDVSVLRIVIAGLLWSVCIVLLRKMAKADPNLSSVYLRHLQYKAFYSARSKVDVK